MSSESEISDCTQTLSQPEEEAMKEEETTMSRLYSVRSNLTRMNL